MRLSAPKKNTFYVSVAIAVVAILSTFMDIPFVSDNAFWVAIVGYAVLAAGNYFKGF